jgi:hypothetical protein
MLQVEDFDIAIIKSIVDSFSGLPVDEEIRKALKPYDTKLINNRWYVWSLTKNGTWNWRLLHKDSKKLTNKSAILDKKAAQAKLDDLKDKYRKKRNFPSSYDVNLSDDVIMDLVSQHISDEETLDPNQLTFEDFPDSLNDLTYIKDLGGSTVAKLFEHSITGEKFVLKKGMSKEHAYEEFLSNKIYEIFGVDAPKVEWYEEMDSAGNPTYGVLSKYEEGISMYNINSDSAKDQILADNFVVDAFMANWDAYQNDNIQMATDGRLIRIDNGGSLRYRARGTDKGSSFSDNAMNDVASMQSHNPWIKKYLNVQKIDQQILNIIAEKDSVLSMLEDRGLKGSPLYKKLQNRFESFEKHLQAKKVDLTKLEDLFVNNRSIYTEFDDKTTDKIQKAIGSNITAQDHQFGGWKALQIIGKERNFTDKPAVVSDANFKTLISSPDYLMVNRGTERNYALQWANSDDCWYGVYGVYGMGVYSTINKNKQLGPPPPLSLSSYDEAKSYSGGDRWVMDIAINSKDFKTVNNDDLDQMIDSELFGQDYHDKKKQYNDLHQEDLDLEDQIKNFYKNIETNIKSQHPLYLESVKSDLMDKSFPETLELEDFISEMETPIQTIGGSFKKVSHQHWEINLPYSDKTFTVNETFAKQGVKKTRNTYFEQIRNFVVNNHFGVVESKIDKAKKSDNQIDVLKATKETVVDKLKKVGQECKDIENKVKWGTSDFSHIKDPFIKECLKNRGAEMKGAYAIYKGYDGIIENRGNRGNQYLIILNRSKCVIRDGSENDYGNVN